MNFKSLIASIGVLLSSMFSPINVKAAEMGDLVQMLEPSIEFDYLTLLDTSNTSNPVVYAEFPNAWDVTGQSGTGQPNYSNSMGIAPMKSVGSSSNNNVIFYVSKVATYAEDTPGKYNVKISMRPGSLYWNDNETYQFGYIPMDLMFTGKDIVVDKDDISTEFFLGLTHGTNADQNFKVDYVVTGNIRDLVYSGNDYAIADFAYSRSGSFDIKGGTSSTSFNPFVSLGDGSHGEYIWFSDLSIQIGISCTDLTYGYISGVTMNMPYYTSAVVAEHSSIKQWMISKGIYDSEVGSNDPTICPTCPICPGDTNINVSYTDWLTTAIGGFFDFELFPGFSFGGVIAIVFILLFVIWVLKVIAGG